MSLCLTSMRRCLKWASGEPRNKVGAAWAGVLQQQVDPQPVACEERCRSLGH
jgi:hypothetical protein